MRLIAHFTPQAWVNDYAITCDSEAPSQWDVTEHLRSMDPDDRRAAMKSDSFESDQLRELPSAPAWVREWSGPFYVRVQAQPDSDSDRALLTLVDGEEVFDWQESGRAGDVIRFQSHISGEELSAEVSTAGLA